MTEAELKDIAEAAARAAVDTTLLRLGIDVNDPDEFIKTRDAIAYARRVHEASETIKKSSLTAAVGVIIAAMLGALWLGFKTQLAELFN